VPDWRTAAGVPARSRSEKEIRKITEKKLFGIFRAVYPALEISAASACPGAPVTGSVIATVADNSYRRRRDNKLFAVILSIAMRHFTHEWIQADSEPDTVRDEAFAYFESIAYRLTPSVHSFRETVNLHDAHMHRISFDAASDSVTFEISELFWDVQLNQGNRRKLFLVYSGQVSVEAFCGPRADRARFPLWEDDLIIDEWDADEQRLEHRMLFASGSEVHVKSSDFIFHHAVDFPETTNANKGRQAMASPSPAT
jgi:hypothetical protein